MIQSAKSFFRILKLGRIWKNGNVGDFKDSPPGCTNDVGLHDISVNEATYIQTQRSDVPYLITKITDIKVTKAGHAEFVTRPFHR